LAPELAVAWIVNAVGSKLLALMVSEKVNVSVSLPA
jgi:hypothetical protein